MLQIGKHTSLELERQRTPGQNRLRARQKEREVVEKRELRLQPRELAQGEILRTPTEEERETRQEGTLSAGALQQQDTGRMAKRAAQRYDASDDSKALYDAMHGGVFGAGTDEDSLFQTLRNKTPEQIDKLRASYRDHYGRDLDADLKDELSGTDLKRATSLMKGDQRSADADALHTAISGGGTDEAAIFSTLEGKTPKQLRAIERRYEQRHGESLRDALAGDLSGDELARANALLDGNSAEADAAAIKNAVRGGGTDEEAIYATLEGKSASERQAIERAYQQKYGTSIRADLADDLSGADLDRATGALDGNTAKTDAARLRQAVDGLGTDEKEIETVLRGKSHSERQAIKAEYQRQYNTTLQSDLEADLSGNDEEKAAALVRKGELSAAEEIHFAIDGVGTDEDAVRSALAGRSKAEIAEIKADYQRRYGKNLDDDLAGDLSGRDEFDAKQALKGTPTSAREALVRMNERRNFERAGLSNAIGSVVMDTMSDKGQLLDDNTRRANEFYAQAMADGHLSRAEEQRLGQLTKYGNQDVNGYQDAKDSAADTAGTIAATGAALAVTVGTAGSGAPLLAVALNAATAGAASRVFVTSTINGRAGGWEGAAEDFAIGAAEGAASVVGAATGAGRSAVNVGLRSAARRSVARVGLNQTDEALAFASANIINNAGRSTRIALGAAEGMVDGALMGASIGVASQGVRDGTWSNGFESGIDQLTEVALHGALIGGGAGIVLGGGLAGLRKPAGFEGTRMNTQYAGEETGAVWGSKVKYLSAEERAQYALTIKNGKLYDASGKLFDTRGGASVFEGGGGNAIFVMGRDGKLYASLNQQVGHFHHSSLLAGQQVAAAGELTVENGVIKMLSNRSGHYMPGELATRQGLRRLAHEGLDLDGIQMRTWDGSSLSAREFIGAN